MKPFTLSMIAALGKNRELGKKNRLLWNIPEDMKHFRDTTRGHTVIMGQKTFESLPGGPLPGRTNIVLSNDPNFDREDVLIARSPDEALELAKRHEKQGEVFVIGGGTVYSLFLTKVDRLYLTLVDAEFPDADVFFPEYEELFREVSRVESQDGSYVYAFSVWEKRGSL